MKDKKTIWIINQYGSLPATGLGGRHRYFSRELAKLGHKVTLISARWTHGTRDEQAANEAPEAEYFEGFKFIRLSLLKYKHAHSKKRVFNWFLFSWKITNLGKKLEEKPDVIIYSSPSLIGFIGASKLAKKFNARLVFEVRDIWPMSLTEIGGYSHKHPFIRFMQWVENKAYRESHKVISNLKNSVEHMVAHGLQRDKFTWIANGFSLEDASQKTPLSNVAELKIPKNKFIIGYTGTLGVANSLDTLVEAAWLLKDCKDIAFVLVGRGKEKEKLQASVESKKLTNITFIDPIPKDQIQAMLYRFDICFIGLKKDPLFRFGVSPNKLFDYLYSAKPIIYAIDSGAYMPVKAAGAGFQIEPENSQAIASAIINLYEMPEAERIQLGENGRKAALEQYEYRMLTEKLEKAVLQ